MALTTVEKNTAEITVHGDGDSLADLRMRLGAKLTGQKDQITPALSNLHLHPVESVTIPKEHWDALGLENIAQSQLLSTMQGLLNA